MDTAGASANMKMGYADEAMSDAMRIASSKFESVINLIDEDRFSGRDMDLGKMPRLAAAH